MVESALGPASAAALVPSMASGNRMKCYCNIGTEFGCAKFFDDWRNCGAGCKSPGVDLDDNEPSSLGNKIMAGIIQLNRCRHNLVACLRVPTTRARPFV